MSRAGGARDHPDAASQPLAPALRGRRRLALIADLAAAGDDLRTLRHLSEIHRIPMSDLQALSAQMADEIEDVARALAGKCAVETAGLWITRKENRIAELQQLLEDIEETESELREAGITWSRSHRDMVRAKLEILRQVADELGAFPQRGAAPAQTGKTVHYVIDTEDTEVLT